MGIGASYSLVFRAHLALALAATLFGGLNVVLEVGLARNETTSTTTRDRVVALASEDTWAGWYRQNNK